jgi:hypothetical protein
MKPSNRSPKAKRFERYWGGRLMSQQLPQGINRQGLDATVGADEARIDASRVELRECARLTPEFSSFSLLDTTTFQPVV